MTRLLELLVSILIVLALFLIVGVLLPSHGHIERSLVISQPLRQVYDSIDTFRRFPEWSALRLEDPRVKFDLSGPEVGTGAKVSWTSEQSKVGAGNLEIVSAEQDSEVKMNLTNDWRGTNKMFTVQIEPQANNRTLKINWSYDVDYGWNLMSRYAGLYINGTPARIIQTNLNNIAAMLATFPPVDYKDLDIKIAAQTAKPILYVSTTAKRTLDDVAEATDHATAEIDAVIKKDNLQKTGPRIIVTTNWGDENYDFDVAIPVDRTDITLPEDSKVKVGQSYVGSALMTTFTGHPAALPAVRLMLKAYAETHGYAYSASGADRYYEEIISDPNTTPEDAQETSVYLPIQLDSDGDSVPVQ